MGKRGHHAHAARAYPGPLTEYGESPPVTEALPAVEFGGRRTPDRAAAVDVTDPCADQDRASRRSAGQEMKLIMKPINEAEEYLPLTRSFTQSGWRDLNSRPLDPQSSALPSCATAR